MRKKERISSKISGRQRKPSKSKLEEKAAFLSKARIDPCRALKRYYKSTGLYSRYKLLKHIDRVANKKIRNTYLSFLRFLYVDFLRGKKRRKFGIYQFIALPGEGKTMSMVAHMERFRKEMIDADVPYVIASNFSYRYNDYYISHWTDMVKISKECYRRGIPCLIALDEIHITFDSTDWKNFPPEMLAMLSFNRKYGLEFCCTSQIYERIPKKVRDIANYTVICKNILGADRLFRDYYFDKSDYEEQFASDKVKKAKAKFVREFVADDDFYRLYDTLEQINRMTENLEEEKNKREYALSILFGDRAEGEG